MLKVEQTRPWFILTGGPGVGKSVEAAYLECQGYQVIHEASTTIRQWEVANGNKEPWKNPKFEERVAKLQVQREARAKSDEITFLDRALPDLKWCSGCSAKSIAG